MLPIIENLIHLCYFRIVLLTQIIKHCEQIGDKL